MPHPLVLDGHNDTLLALQRAWARGEPADFGVGLPGHLDLVKARAGGWGGGFFACFVPSVLEGDDIVAVAGEDGAWHVPDLAAIDPDHALRTTLGMVARLLELEAAGHVRVVRDVAGIRVALDDGVLAAILHLEGCEALDPELDRLPVLHALGLRSVGPVWSRPNAFGTGVPFRFPSTNDIGPGLTDAGRRLVRRCNELGILLDLAHLNRRGIADVAQRSDAPLVASHACAHALTPTARNLTDDQLRLIGDSGGVVGINLSAGDLSTEGADDPSVPLARWAEHAEHVASVAGVGAVALGSDFDGATMPAAVADASGTSRLLDELSSRGWSAQDVEAVAQGNWLRVLEATWRA